MRDGIVITGAGVVSPIGCGVVEFWDSLLSRRSGVTSDVDIDLSELPCGWMSGIVPADDRARIINEYGGRAKAWGDLMMLDAVQQAMRDANISVAGDKPVGLVWTQSCPASGSTPDEYLHYLESQDKLRSNADGDPVKIRRIIQMDMVGTSAPSAYLPSILTAELGVDLLPLRIEATCSGGLRAIIEGTRMLETEDVQFVIVAASVSRRTPYLFSQYAQINAMSHWRGDPSEGSRPFDKDRSGMVLGEAAAVLILEREGPSEASKNTYGRIGPWAMAVGTEHVTAPKLPWVERVIREVAEAALRQNVEISAINAHGTSTKLNDVTESRALEAIFGEALSRLPVMAVKSLTGHCSSASGILEVIASCLCLCRQEVFPMPARGTLDPDCRVAAPGEILPIRLDSVIKDSFGFGGQYISLLVEKPLSPKIWYK